MYEETTVGVVVPAYNEEGFVGEVIETLPSYVDRAYVVDDRSTDDTWTEIQRVADRVNALSREVRTGVVDSGRNGDGHGSGGGALLHGDGGSPSDDEAFEPRIVPIRHERNRGVGGAIKTGYLRARRDGIDVTAVMGGDGQMDPDELETVIEPVANGRADYAKGNRLLTPEDREEMPRLRYVGNVILSSLTRIASGYWRIGDPQNGYAAISIDALDGTEIEGMFEFYGYCNDLLVRLSANEFRVVDVPISARYRDEESHIEYRTYVPLVSFMLLRSFLWRLSVRRTPPVQAARSGLYVLGATGVLAGAVDLARRAVGTLRNSNSHGQNETLADESRSVRSDGSTDRTAPAIGSRDVNASRLPSVDDGRSDGAGQGNRSGRGKLSVVIGVVLLICGMAADAALNWDLNGRDEQRRDE